MFIIKTKEGFTAGIGAQKRQVLVYLDGVLHTTAEWNADRDAAWNHRNGALASLLKVSSRPGFTPHHILGAAPVPGHDFWAVMVREGD